MRDKKDYTDNQDPELKSLDQFLDIEDVFYKEDISVQGLFPFTVDLERRFTNW